MIKYSISNEQDKLPFDEEIENVIKEAVKTTLEVLDWGDVDCIVDITVTDNENIREINREHRNIDRETDVLSFPQLEFSPEGEVEVSDSDYLDGFLVLGDIVISLEKAKAQSEEYGHSLKREAGFLALHSALHLMGFDHETDSDRAEMRALEEEILRAMNLSR